MEIPGIVSIQIGNGIKEDVFENKCLLASVILGYYRINPEKDSYKRLFPLLSMRDCTKRNERKRLDLAGTRCTQSSKTEAGKHLESLIRTLCEKLDIEFEGPHNLLETLPKLASYFKVQIHLIESVQERNASIRSFPDKFDERCQQIFLYWSHDCHVNLIIDLSSFFRHFRNKICFGCEQSFSFYYRHECNRARDSCRKCKRILPKGDLSKGLDSFFKFCDSVTSEERLKDPKTCEKGCNFKFESLDCYKYHDCNRNGFHCDVCGKTFASGFKNLEDAKLRHPCNPSLQKCPNCRALKNGNHQCRFHLQSPTKKWPNLGFFTFSTLIREECVECFELKKQFVSQKGVSWKRVYDEQNQMQLLCNLHKTQDLCASANAVMLAFEKERGKLEFAYFCDDELESEKLEEEDEPIIFSYDCDILNESRQKKGFKKKMRGMTERLQRQKNTQLNAVQKFLHFVNTPEFQDFTFLSTNGESCSHQFILREYFNLGIKPFVIMEGNKIKKLGVNGNNVQFLSASCFLSGSTFDWLDVFNLDNNMYFFPENFNAKSNYKYRGEVPDLNSFLSFSDCREVIDAKKSFHTELELRSCPWVFKDELRKTLLNQTTILSLSCLTFLRDSLSFQKKLQSALKDDSSGLIHPFDHSVTSLAAYSFKTFSLFFLNQTFKIHNVDRDASKVEKHVSRSELELATYLSKKHPEHEYIFFNSRPEGQKKFGRRCADIYSPVKNKVISFNGCKFHYCLNESCPIKKASDDESQSVFGLSLDELKERDAKDRAFFESQNIEFIVYSECEWRKQKQISKGSDDLLARVCNDLKKDPLFRMIPRVAMRGGLLDVYHLKWKESDFPDEAFYYMDINSLYPYVAMTEKYPVGEYEVIVGAELEKVEIDAERATILYDKVPIYHGAAFVRVRPPSNLKFPFLQYRVKNKFNFLTLCHSCTVKKKKKCKHTVGKCLQSTWMISDLAFALKLGYTIEKVFEIHYYPESDFIFQRYVTFLYSLKVKYSGWPDHVKTTVDQNAYCEEINNHLNLPPEFALIPNDICKNSAKKETAKGMLNHLFGKFSQSEKPKTEYVVSVSRFNNLVQTAEILNIARVTDETIQVKYLPKKQALNRCTNVYIGAQVNSYARITLYKHLISLSKVKAKIYAIDTDAIFFSLKKDVKNPLRESNLCGDFKNMIPGQITSFFCLGSKNYNITFRSDSQQMQCKTVVKGALLSNFCNETSLSGSVFEKFIEDHFNKTVSEIVIPQLRFCVDKSDFSFSKRFQDFTFDNELFIKGYVNDELTDEEKKRYPVFPFGFKENN